MILLALVLLCAPSAPALSRVPAQESSSRHQLANVILVGPLEQVRFAVEPMGESIVRTPLLAGERRSVTLPLPVWGETTGLVPEVEVLGAGSATFEGWSGANAAAAAAWNELPRSLRRRRRVAPPPSAPIRVPRTALLLAATALAAGWALRGRPRTSILVSLLGAACMLLLVGPPSPAPALRVLEGDGPSGAWLDVRAARDRVVGEVGDGPLRVECQPARARLVYELDLSRPEAVTWVLRGEASVFFLLTPLDSNSPGYLPAGGQITAESNTLVPLAEAWVRAADGSGWSAVGVWREGSLPPELRPEDPPGWLNPALPLGRRVLVGRVQAGGGPSGAELLGEIQWVRLVGL